MAAIYLNILLLLLLINGQPFAGAQAVEDYDETAAANARHYLRTLLKSIFSNEESQMSDDSEFMDTEMAAEEDGGDEMEYGTRDLRRMSPPHCVMEKGATVHLTNNTHEYRPNYLQEYSCKPFDERNRKDYPLDTKFCDSPSGGCVTKMQEKIVFRRERHGNCWVPEPKYVHNGCHCKFIEHPSQHLRLRTIN